ncbi:MAG: hypothetical protein ACYC1F_10415 [Gallionellaceae bacterium]
MNLATELQTVTAAEITASYRAANLRRLRPGYSLLTALNTPCVERALRLHALALRKKQQHGEPAPTQWASQFGEKEYA